MNAAVFTGQAASTPLDGAAFARLLDAGIRHLFRRRDLLNRINVFPVPDGDTGTNLAFTFRSIREVLPQGEALPLPDLMGRLVEAALDGARGNSGAIVAQYLQGFREAVGQRTVLDAPTLAAACAMGAKQAWTAMSEPVPGTLPTVMEAHACAVGETAEATSGDLRAVFDTGLEAARDALAATPDQLPVLKQAGVVDAGGQGFVDLLEGIGAWLDDGVLDALEPDWEDEAVPAAEGPDLGEHQYCTECVIEGRNIPRQAVMKRLQALDQSSLVVAGSETRVRVHIHVNNPAEVFLACEDFGEITRQKADDMRWQHGLLNHPGHVAVVTDSGADLPPQEAERLGLHVVPVRLSFGDREYLDGVDLDITAFHRMLEAGGEPPRTSQPPPRDFRRVFELLGTHGYQVLYVGLSKHLSGTYQAGEAAGHRAEGADVRSLDSLSASAGQGLLALLAAELAAGDRSRDDIVACLEGLVPRARVMAMPRELDSAVRGGRVKPWVGKLAQWLRITPVLTARAGRMGLDGVHLGQGVDAERFAKRLLKAMEPNETYRLMISHVGNPEGARELRRKLLAGHGRIHSCHLAEAGPALGVHLGIGGLIVGFVPDPHRAGSESLRD